MKYKVGDKVEVVFKNNQHNGRIGTVELITENGLIILSLDPNYLYYEDELELIQEPNRSHFSNGGVVKSPYIDSSMLADQYSEEIYYGKVKKENKCTCGAHKCGSNLHSDWCDYK